MLNKKRIIDAIAVLEEGYKKRKFNPNNVINISKEEQSPQSNGKHSEEALSVKDFTIKRFIGSGAFGQVLEAHMNDKRYAIKKGELPIVETQKYFKKSNYF